VAVSDEILMALKPGFAFQFIGRSASLVVGQLWLLPLLFLEFQYLQVDRY
jgi:hypothetical protein